MRTAKSPMKMDDKIIDYSEKEKYLGDVIHEKGCAASISETINERTRKLANVIKLAENLIMEGLGNSTAAFKLYEASIIPALLHNCESWVGINDKHLKSLQDFQDKFIRKLLGLAKSTPKAIINWDIGLQPMKWRIAYKKLVFLQKILGKDHSNIC